MAKMVEPQRLEREIELEVLFKLLGQLAFTETEDNALLLLSETLTGRTGILNRSP